MKIPHCPVASVCNEEVCGNELVLVFGGPFCTLLRAILFTPFSEKLRIHKDHAPYQKHVNQHRKGLTRPKESQRKAIVLAFFNVFGVVVHKVAAGELDAECYKEDQKDHLELCRGSELVLYQGKDQSYCVNDKVD